MLKTLNIFIITFVFLELLNAIEPTLATLNNTISNDTQRFSIKNSSFICNQYAIVTLEKLYSNSKSNSTCSKSIENFYIQNPDLQYFSSNLLKVKQMYHIEFKGEECIIFAKGEKSLSEFLLENGLGVLKPLFKDKEYGTLYKHAQEKAEFLKTGMWSENIVRECTVELHK